MPHVSRKPMAIVDDYSPARDPMAAPLGHIGECRSLQAAERPPQATKRRGGLCYVARAPAMEAV